MPQFYYDALLSLPSYYTINTNHLMPKFCNSFEGYIRDDVVLEFVRFFLRPDDFIISKQYAMIILEIRNDKIPEFWDSFNLNLYDDFITLKDYRYSHLEFGVEKETISKEVTFISYNCLKKLANPDQYAILVKCENILNFHIEKFNEMNSLILSLQN